MRTKHASVEEIALWILDAESDHLARAARRHLEEGCSLCSAVSASLRELETEVRRAVRANPSERVLARARALVREMAHREAEMLVAALIEDTALLSGVRGEAGEGRQLLFSVGDFDLDLRVRPARRGGRAEIRGQIHGPAAVSMERIDVRLLQGERLLARAETDSLGEFRIVRGPLPPFHLELVGAGVRIRTVELAS